MDLVSVITPYYKKKNFIKEAILSALNQTYQNLEIFIIYDDECPVDLDYIKEIKSLDKRINLIINTKKLGAGLSRNLAIKSWPKKDVLVPKILDLLISQYFEKLFLYSSKKSNNITLSNAKFFFNFLLIDFILDKFKLCLIIGFTNTKWQNLLISLALLLSHLMKSSLIL